MKTKHIIYLPILGLAAILMSCSPNSKSDVTVAAKSPEVALKKVENATKENAKAIKEYAHSQKAEFVANMKVELEQTKSELNAIIGKMDKASAELKAKAQPKILALQEQMKQLDTQLEAVNNSAESTWDSVKSTFSSAYDSTKNGVKEARQWLSNQIEP